MWTLIIVAGLEVYSGASVHMNYIDGFTSQIACERAAETVKQSKRIQLNAFCVSKDTAIKSKN